MTPRALTITWKNQYAIVLSDGTCWAIPDLDKNGCIQWVSRYGSIEELTKARYLIAEALSTFEALVFATAKRRAEVIRLMREALSQEGSEDE